MHLLDYVASPQTFKSASGMQDATFYFQATVMHIAQSHS